MGENKQLPFINRELSWMDFNWRVLEEAFEKENPVMERLRFLGITSSNLDEFFMVRVAGVKAQVHSGYKIPDLSGLTPDELMVRLTRKIRSFTEQQYTSLHRSILPALRKENVFFCAPSDLSEEQQNFLSDYFDKILYPVLTPPVPHAHKQEPESGGSPEGRGGIPVCGGTGAVDPLPFFAGTRPGTKDLCAARKYYLL